MEEEFESSEYYLNVAGGGSGGGGSEANLSSSEEVDGATMDVSTNILYTPNKEIVDETLQWAFHVHAYGFAFLFFFLAFYSFFSILNLRSQLSTRPYMTTINSFLCLLGASRAAVLFIDPYGLKQTMPLVMGTLLWDLGFPALISSFSLIQIAFLQLTQLVPQHKLCQLSPTDSTLFVISEWNNKPYLQMDVGPETFRKKTCLSLVITLHFSSVIISAIYTSLNPDLMLGKLMIQLLFGIWGFLLCGSFIVAGKRVLGLLGSSSGASSEVTTHNDKGIANLFGMGMLGHPGGGQNLASSLTAALAPTLLQGSIATSSSSSGPVGSSKETPKIQITDVHDRTICVPTQASRLNDIPEVPEKSLPPSIGSTSPRSSFSGPGGKEINDSEATVPSSSTGGPGYVRPPSPVLPRRKSSGPGLRGTGPRRLSWNTRRDSGGGELLSTTPTDPVRKKSLTWCEVENPDRISTATDKRRASRKSFDATDASSERNGGTETLLSTSVGPGPDYTLQSILSHIAYVNQTALDYRLSRKLSRTDQVHKVVKYTSVTAVLGFILCVGELIRILSPYGILASSVAPSVWPWFILQSLCRIAEFAMGATVANITKQPASRPHHYAYSIRHKHHRESLYL